MGKWEMVRLINVCDLNMGQSPESSSYNLNGEGIPFYQGNADFGLLNPITRYYCNKPTKIAKKDDILISVRAPIGALNIATENCCIGRGLAALTAKKNLLDIKFLYYVLGQKNAELNQKGTGSTFKAINKQNLSEVLCPLPPLATQKQIAQTLDTVAELLALRNRHLAELDNLIKSVFYDMFGDPVQMDKQPKIKLNEFILFLTSGSRGWAQYYTETGDAFIRINNVRDACLKLDDIVYVTPPNNAEAKRTKVKTNDLLFSITADLGRTAVVNEILDGAYINQHLALIRLRQDRINPIFVAWYFVMPYGKSSVMKKNREGVKAGLNFDDIRGFEIITPSLLIQNQFASIVTKIEEQKVLVKKAINETQYLFDSLMSEYFDV